MKTLSAALPLVLVLAAITANVSLSVAQPTPAASRAADPLALGTARFDVGKPATLDVVRAKTGHLLVRPVINGRAAGAFIFDTGAGTCVISTPHIEEFGLTPAGEVQSAGIGGSQTSKVYRASTLSLGPVTFENHPVMAADLSFLKAYLDEEIVGVIGYGVLSRVVAEIDLATPRIALHDPAQYTLTAGTWSPLLLDDRVPAVRVRFEDHDALLKIDIGSNMALSFHEPAVRKWSLLEGRELADVQKGGVGGFIAAKRGAIRWIEVGGVRQENVLALFALEAKGVNADTSRDGHIGVPLLARFLLVMDYGRKRVAFVEPPRAGQSR